MLTRKGGVHLSIVRRFIQDKAVNGSTVTFGSNEFLQLKPLTAADMEDLAHRIRNAVFVDALHQAKININNILDVMKIQEE